MTDREGESPTPKEESKKERIDRELMELLQELRVAIPGVQILFAFLLTIPFAQGFGAMTEVERNMYAVTLLLSAAATGLLIAPTSYHRLHFRAGNKEKLLFSSNRMAVLGLLLLASAISCAVFVVLSVVFTGSFPIIAVIVTAVWFGWFWYGLPLLRRGPDE
jgi:Family of unknown function (DUF6328)